MICRNILIFDSRRTQSHDKLVQYLNFSYSFQIRVQTAVQRVDVFRKVSITCKKSRQTTLKIVF